MTIDIGPNLRDVLEMVAFTVIMWGFYSIAKRLLLP